ncbi:MAG: hypothetical protein A3H97_14055 [Acidobacteria bacterium RIFCSPLOWO2_02_FULL_65_29]|nr:MAG: hypothetical protein A3H97_14055 [Acidobacteria bacterium RIFCSPLOWO2_02_FULL_65_29]
MIITKMALPRRTFLRGLGAVVALPVLDAMVPALSAAQTAARPAVPRLGFVYAPNGSFLPNFFPQQVGRQFELTPVLKPLESVRDRIVVVSGLANKGAENLSEGGGVHTRIGAAWLSGTRPKKTEGTDIEAGTSIDQIAAAQIGRDTPLQSLQITLDHDIIVGSCENGYSCVYQHTFSWKSPTTPMPMESNPRSVFERLFGEGGTAAERMARLRQDRSVLDLAKGDMARLRRRLGLKDRSTVDDYLTAVRDVELRIQRAERSTDPTRLPDMPAPVGVPDSWDEHAKLMFDLTLLAYQADITRVVAFQISRELNGRAYPWIGVPDGHHSVSHHQLDPEKITKATKINAYHMSLFARLLERMRDTPDGDGSLLDHSLMMYGTGMGDSDHHTPVNIPTVLAGGACGRLDAGRFVQYPADTPMMNLGMTVLDKVGVQVERVGDSTGRLANL